MSKKVLGSWAIFVGSVFGGLLVTMEAAQAESVQQSDAEVKIAESCTISANGNRHVATLTPGTFQAIGENTTFDVFCNDKEGYVIYAVGISGDKEGTTDMIGAEGYTIPTGTSQEGQAANWSFKLSNPSEGTEIQPGFDNYSVIPARKTAVIKRTAYTQETAGVDHFNATYGVYVSATTPADTYEGKVLYTLFHPNTTEIYNYHIEFDLNEGVGGPTNNPQIGEVTDNVVRLDGSVPVRDDYAFLGWCTQETEGEVCAAEYLRQPGDEIPLASKNEKFSLYAVWKPLYRPIPPECKGLTTIGNTGSMSDPRDGNSYTIAHLSDSKCWMTQNLRLGGDDMISRDLDASNTDTDHFTMPVDDPNKSDFPDTTGDGEAHLEYAGNDEYGYYYNWYAATGGTGTRVQDSGDAPGSICPKDWRLPTKEEADVLSSKYSIDEGSAAPVNLVFSGLCYAGNCPQNQGQYGFWWTSTASSSSKAYYMFLYKGSAFGANDWWAKGTGFTVRCVARNEGEPRSL